MNLHTPTLLVVLAVCLIPITAAAQSDIPRTYRGQGNQVARGVMDGNLIETNYRNHGELSRYNDIPHGVWPRGTGGRHIDGAGILIAGVVNAERVKWASRSPFYVGKADTTVTPAILNYRDFGRKVGPEGYIWGWLPLPGFHNTTRIDPVTGSLRPVPAKSTDPTSWPAFWPDRLDNPDDPGWAGRWNGLFGKGVFNADQETYYVIDDWRDYEYRIDPETGVPNSRSGVFYADPGDSTLGGLGLQVQVRHLQWANILAEDIMFLLYRVTNVGQYNHDSLYFTNIVDFGLGQDESNGQAEYNAQLDMAFGWDRTGVGIRPGGGTYALGYVGFAFLESPGNSFDAVDNDEDGITDERRDAGPGMLIEGQDNIRAYVQATYNMARFTATFGALEDRPAYRLGYWWTGDENMTWRRYEDMDGNGQWDPGEPINDDVGMDGLGPNDLGYPGPDSGEADGIPNDGEPNFDQLDIQESDQIGLTGFDLSTRPFYESGENLRTDSWLYGRILFSQFPLGQEPESFIADVEPFLMFASGPVVLPPNSSDFFSLAWIFGANRTDFLKNRQVVQNIYDANYNFAQAPFLPTLTAIPGDGMVTLTWDSISVASFDRFTQEFDFEGYRLYKGTDPLLSDARLVTNVDGIPTFYRPLAQWDLANGIVGNRTVLGGEAVYNLGTDSGLQFFYIDRNVKNGVRYYYALVAYDRGVISDDGDVSLDPIENVFNFAVDGFGNVRGQSINARAVVPRARAAGFVSGGANEDLSRVTSGFGTGSIRVTVGNEELVKKGNVYRMEFTDTTASTEFYATRSYRIRDLTENVVLLDDRALDTSTPLIDGFVVEIFNHPVIRYFDERTGWVQNYGTDNELTDKDARKLDGLQTNWTAIPAIIDPTESTFARRTPNNFELRFTNLKVYRPPLFQTSVYRRDSLNVRAFNLTTGAQVDLLWLDENDNATLDPGDQLVISDIEPGFGRRLRHRITFSLPSGTSSAPREGDVFRIANRKPFKTGDYFQFTISDATVDTALAKSELDKIAVVPNPYIGAAEWDLRTVEQGRSDRRVQFIHLPVRCTIRIYNVRGELVTTLNHQSVGSDGAMFWDMRTKESLDVAYGVYIYHVDAPGIGEKIGKFAIVK